MSDFTDAIFENLALRSQLNNPNNQLRKVLDKTVGAWFDENGYNVFNFFINTATGKYLDLFGRDYGILRNIDESDEDYRNRIILEKLDHLTPRTLSEEYNVRLYHYIDQFNIGDNTLTSDNPFNTDFYMGVASDEVRSILDFKFAMDTGIVWLNNDGVLDYILDSDDANVLRDYVGVYTAVDGYNYFDENNVIKEVKLNLPYTTTARIMFVECSNLSKLDLTMPQVVNCQQMVKFNDNLTEVNLDLPLAENCIGMCAYNESLTKAVINMPNMISDSIAHSPVFEGCSSLEYVDVVVPDDLDYAFESYMTGGDFPNLTTLIINGEEVDL